MDLFPCSRDLTAGEMTRLALHELNGPSALRVGAGKRATHPGSDISDIHSSVVALGLWLSGRSWAVEVKLTCS